VRHRSVTGYELTPKRKSDPYSPRVLDRIVRTGDVSWPWTVNYFLGRHRGEHAGGAVECQFGQKKGRPLTQEL